MTEDNVEKYLRGIGLQLKNVQAMLINISNSQPSRVETRTCPFGVKDITTAQLVDAYRRGLTIEGLVALANGKYTAEQIKIKIIRATGGNY